MHCHSFLQKILWLTAASSAVTSNGSAPQVRWIVSLPHAGWLGFNLSKMDQLVRIVVQDGVTGDFIPIARSYDGSLFEVAPGPYANGALPLDCSTETQFCELNIAAVQKRGSLLEITYSSYLDPNSEKGRNARVARFLEQATFGPSIRDIASFFQSYGSPGESTFQSWIWNQMHNVPLTSHREFYRQNTNPRWDRVSKSARSMKNPCARSARWRAYALTSRDAALKKFSVEAFGGTKYLLKINGEVRTVLDSIEMEPGSPSLVLGMRYDMCAAQREFWMEAVGQPYPKLSINGGCWALKNGSPRINLDGVSGIAILDLNGATFSHVDNVQYDSSFWTSLEAADDYILSEDFNSPTCASLHSPYGKSGGAPGPTIFGIMNGQYLAYDPRLVLETNTVEKPLWDGGGTAVLETSGQMMCSNAPRSFINEDHCRLSTSVTACSSTVPPTTTIKLDAGNLDKITKLVASTFAFVDIPFTFASFINADGNTESYVGRSPCYRWHWDVKVRFERMPDSVCTQHPLTVQQETRNVFAKYLNPEFDDPINPNPRYKTIGRRPYNQCAPVDQNNEDLIDLGYMTADDGTCWKHVHPLEGNIYVDQGNFLHTNFRNWQKGDEPNVLTLSRLTAEGQDASKFMYDSIHKSYSLIPGHLDDVIKFDSLPALIATQAVRDALSQTVSNAAGDGVVVCGSVGEISNAPFRGEGFQYSWEYFREDLDVAEDMYEQRHTIWAYTALKAPDQLRQRMAWALSQICVVGHSQIDDMNTEAAVQYYDIFVRDAFGSYRDILKKVAFSERMGVFLSSIENKSFQFSKSEGVEAFPDENFAREVMQLFSIGLIRLNIDGTPMIGTDGKPIETYRNDDLTSYARAWTGFQGPQIRGNNDGVYGRVDPMNIVNDWHDVFPKTDLIGGYIGDRNYPLCTDLPTRHALRKGATYRLLGSSNTPELMFEPTYAWEDWGSQPYLERLELSTVSPLFQLLCSADGNGQCTYPAKLVLHQNLDYSDINLRNGLEYTSESLRTIRVRSGRSSIYYEYVRQPCVELSFFRNGIKVQHEPVFVQGTNPRVYTVENSLCADPRRDVATESCCPLEWVEGNTDDENQGYKFCNFFGERMSFDAAAGRCAANGMKACTTQRWSDYVTGYCGFGRRHMWTVQGCQLRVKINAASEIAMVHQVEWDFSGKRDVWTGVDASTRNFFRPAWITEFQMSSCAATPGCEYLSDGCLCNVLVDESVAFSSAPRSLADILRECFIGAVDPSMAPDEYRNDLGTCDISGVTKVYSKRSASCTQLGPDVVFQYQDEFGITRYAKNMISTVEIGESYSFRTPVQFLSLADPELRDTLYEFEAIIDSLFYHPNHPPFMAKNLLKRFGHSNPSPDLVKTVALAYKSGSYKGIGSHRYGDLAALVAAILLHPESTSLSLLSDPTFGQLREPLVKVVSFMRSMEYKHDSPLYIPLLNGLQAVIRQESFEQPSVFNYYLPEYVPPGPIGASGLVSPESMLLAGDAVTNLVDGLFRMVKVGLDYCDAGLATYGLRTCATTDGDTSLSLGSLGFSQIDGSHDQVLDTLALVLTSNRLSDQKRDFIFNTTANEFQYGDRKKAIRAMMQLIASTAEFHTTAVAENSFQARLPKISTGIASSNYKAVIFFFFNGGMDSYSMLAPKAECHAEYVAARGRDLAVPLSDLLDIDATQGTGQSCNTFGVHKNFPLAKDLHDNGELTFFANMGLLQFPVDKYNYHSTQSNLFSHNSQQYAVQRLDIKNFVGETGVGGRLMDELSKLGFKTSSNSVNSHAHAAAGDPRLSNPKRQVSIWYPEDFNRHPTLNTTTLRVKELNGIGSKSNNVFAETWSESLTESLYELDEANSIMQNQAFAVSDFKTKPSILDRQFQSVARYIKSRKFRNVDREIFVIEDGGYDMHDCNCIGTKLATIDSTLRAFRAEMMNQGVWDNVVIVTGSDFGRTLTSNSGGGTDHGWAGNYFMMGGDVKGKQILGSYPDLTDSSSLKIDARGRMVPTLTYDAMWNGVAQWMGVQDEARLDYMLPHRESFPKCRMFTDAQLFKSGRTPAYPCT